MKILGIETSCDETAAAVVLDGRVILSNVVVSQIDIFKEYGGVIPEVAARSHLEVVLPVINKALADAACSWDEIDAIAVTHAPGLLGSLLIGTLTARTLAILHNKPLYAVHHLKSHVYANWLSEGDGPSFPLLAMVVSGGHTQILYMRGYDQFEIIGTTRDDAVGECFDKVAKILGLPYPGGPSIAKAALEGDPKRYKLPKPNVSGLDFSFSGLKTAVLRAVQGELGLPISHPSYDLRNHLTAEQVVDFAASFQEVASEILIDKLKKAVLAHPEVRSIVFAGGVSANRVLREKAVRAGFRGLPEGIRETFREGCSGRGGEGEGDDSKDSCLEEAKNTSRGRLEGSRGAPEELPVYFPAIKLSGDNGTMVAAAGYFEIISGVQATDPYKLNIYPRISIES